MYDYLWDTDIDGEKIICDLALAKAIYKRIKEIYPDINDELLKKYFKIALDNMMNIKVTEQRKRNRIKRLNLNQNFNWNTKKD